MVAIPEIEPTEVRAGDTWKWTITLDDYPAPTWVLTYYFRSPVLDQVERLIAATNDSGKHAVVVPATTTDDYPPGNWRYVGRVVSGSESYSIRSGRFVVLANAADNAVDDRTYSERALDALLALREGRASSDQSNFSIGDVSISRMSHDEVEDQYLRFKRAVARERGVEVDLVRVRM